MNSEELRVLGDMIEERVRRAVKPSVCPRCQNKGWYSDPRYGSVQFNCGWAGQETPCTSGDASRASLSVREASWEEREQ